MHKVLIKGKYNDFCSRAPPSDHFLNQHQVKLVPNIATIIMSFLFGNRKTSKEGCVLPISQKQPTHQTYGFIQLFPFPIFSRRLSIFDIFICQFVNVEWKFERNWRFSKIFEWIKNFRIIKLPPRFNSASSSNRQRHSSKDFYFCTICVTETGL